MFLSLVFLKDDFWQQLCHFFAGICADECFHTFYTLLGFGSDEIMSCPISHHSSTLLLLARYVSEPNQFTKISQN